MIAALEPRHRVVAFDLRGMGESDKPHSRYDFDELADDLEFVSSPSSVCEDVTLVGWSMGCTVSPAAHGSAAAATSSASSCSTARCELARTDDDSSRAR